MHNETSLRRMLKNRDYNHPTKVTKETLLSLTNYTFHSLFCHHLTLTEYSAILIPLGQTHANNMSRRHAILAVIWGGCISQITLRECN